MGGRDLTVIKLGGSHAFAPHLTDWIDEHTNAFTGFLATTLADAVTGIIAGGLVVAAVTVGKRLFGRKDVPAH